MQGIFQDLDNFDELYLENECDNIDILNGNIGDFNWAVLHVNIRGLNANITTLEAYLANLKIQPQVIVCSETWNLSNPALYALQNYKIYYNNGIINSADGVVIYVRHDIVHRTEIVEYDKFKGLNCIATIDEKRQILITALYRCHDFSKSEFLDVIKSITMNSKNSNHIIIGDFNIDILKFETEAEEILNNCYSAGFTPLFKTITRPNFNGGSCIDNMFIKTDIEVKAFKHSQVLPDHYPLFCCWNIDEVKKSEEKYFYKINYRKLLNTASKINWLECTLDKDPECGINLLISRIKQCIEIALVKIKKTKTVFRKPWMTEAIFKSIAHKEFLYNLWKQNKTSDILKNEYKTYEKILQKVIKVAKETFEIKKADESTRNPKKLWKYINDKLGKK